MLKVIDNLWFTSNSTVGIILAENDVGEIHAYVGHGTGGSEDNDMNHIMSYGAKVKPEDVIEFLFKGVK